MGNFEDKMVARVFLRLSGHPSIGPIEVSDQLKFRMIAADSPPF